MAERITDLCQRYGLEYTTGPLWRQYGQTLRTIWRLSLPDRMAGARQRSESEGPGVSLRSRARRSSGAKVRRQWQAAPTPDALVA